ncbi:MAG: HupE/UreJ family protein [Gemmatimonadales bacterium]
MKRLAAALLLMGSCAVAASAAAAHEVRPGYLELRQLADGTYDVLFKVPARGDWRLSLDVRFPAHCVSTDPTRRFDGVAYIDRYRVTCAGGLIGEQVVIVGLSDTRTDVLARVERADGTTQVARLTPRDFVFTVVAAPGAAEVAQTYFGLGVQHILFGFDHLLFVLALVLVVGDWGRLAKTVTAFTVAHSLTLGAATLGLVHVPQKPVEAAIALSIAFVAADILRAADGRPSLTTRAPWLMAFLFGLLHGLGFASALSEIGLPAGDIPLALLLFNVGVEAGQLLFIAAVLLAIAVARRLPAAVPRLARPLPAYAIGALAMFWVIERVVGFA